MAGCGRPDQVNPLFPIKRLPCKFRVNVRQMRPNESRENDAVGCFRTTHWSVVLLSTASFSDRKSTRLNSSHTVISYAVFCLKKKKYNNDYAEPNLQCLI